MNLSGIPDLLCVLLSLWHPAFILVAIIQYGARRNAFLARGLWLRFGSPAITDMVLILLPGLDVMSNEAEEQAVPSGSGTSSEPVPNAVLAHQNHSEPENELRNTVIALAIMKRSNGDYLFGANEIRNKVGGNAAKIKGWVAEARPQLPQGQRRIERPEGGW
jgi:hypothetical protein